MRKRVLFLAEAVTLAHAARPYVLAKGLASPDYEVHFAVADRYPLDFGNLDIRRWPLRSIAPEAFRDSLASGTPLYNAATLTDYVNDDLELIDKVSPHLVVGDFRLSLAVSAALRNVHYINVTNAHWSPFSTRKRLPFPEHALGKLVGSSVASVLFNAVAPLILRTHAAPHNKLRRAHGLAPLGDLRSVYTWGDTTLYADVPELVQTRSLPASHRYIGPLLYSPEGVEPPWWAGIPQDRPCIYLTLGSSGQTSAVSAILRGLASLPVTVLLSTAGRDLGASLPDNVLTADFLPGSAAARRSDLVVCNGGSATVYQALAESRPVLGLPSNLDQHLTMASVCEAGAGLSIRAEEARSANVARAVVRLLDANGNAKTCAGRVATWFNAYRASDRFGEVVAEVLRGVSVA